FTTFFKHYMESDLPELAAEIPLGPFPVVKLRGPVAFIGLSSAVPRLPLVSSGSLGALQLEALERILAHEEVKKRTPVFAIHHPAHAPTALFERLMRGLSDAAGLARALGGVSRGLLLHGHLRPRVQQTLSTRAGSVLSVGAT